MGLLCDVLIPCFVLYCYDFTFDVSFGSYLILPSKSYGNIVLALACMLFHDIVIFMCNLIDLVTFYRIISLVTSSLSWAAACIMTSKISFSAFLIESLCFNSLDAPIEGILCIRTKASNP